MIESSSRSSRTASKKNTITSSSKQSSTRVPSESSSVQRGIERTKEEVSTFKNDYEQIDTRISKLKSQIEEQKKVNQELSFSYDAKKIKLDYLSDQLSLKENHINSRKDVLGKFSSLEVSVTNNTKAKNAQQDLTETIDNYKNQLKEIRTKIQEEELTLMKMSQKDTQGPLLEMTIKEMKSQISKTTQRVMEYQRLYSEICPKFERLNSQEVHLNLQKEILQTKLNNSEHSKSQSISIISIPLDPLYYQEKTVASLESELRVMQNRLDTLLLYDDDDIQMNSEIARIQSIENLNKKRSNELKIKQRKVLINTKAFEAKNLSFKYHVNESEEKEETDPKITQQEVEAMRKMREDEYTQRQEAINTKEEATASMDRANKASRIQVEADWKKKIEKGNVLREKLNALNSIELQIHVEKELIDELTQKQKILDTQLNVRRRKKETLERAQQSNLEDNPELKTMRNRLNNNQAEYVGIQADMKERKRRLLELHEEVNQKEIEVREQKKKVDQYETQIQQGGDEISNVLLNYNDEQNLFDSLIQEPV